MKLKNKIMDTTEIMTTFFNERNSSKNTKHAYLHAIRLFEKVTNTPLSNIIYLAEQEQENNMSWKNQSLRILLIDFRRYVYENYKLKSAKLYMSRVIAVFRHFEITVEKLPYYSTKSANPSIPINPDKLVDREILKLCINTSTPLLKALVLHMSSSGMSKTDTLNLKVKNYIDATYETHQTNHLPNALEILSNNNDTIGFWENLQRQKTGQLYYTFSSNESIVAIAQYLLTRENLTMESPLFDINYKYMSDLFKSVNDQLGLGKNGQFSRFASHMLRRYHATQLIESGMAEAKVDLLQGRKPRSIAYTSYIKIKPSKLKQEYIEALPYLVVEDITKVKTELDIVKDENVVLKEQNERYKELVDSIDERIERKIFEAMKVGLSDDEVDDLFS